MAKDRMDVLELLRKEAPDADLEFLREGVRVLAPVMEAEVATKTGASFREPSSERTTYGNGYRARPSDTRVGALELQVPKVREGSSFPSLLEPRRRSGQALLAVVQQADAAGASTRRVEDLVQAHGCGGISKSQVSRICQESDAGVDSFLGRPLDGGLYPYLWLDALAQKVSEDGRTVNVSVAVATGVNREGKRDQQPSPEEAHAQHARMVGMIDERFPQAADLLADVGRDILACTAFPVAHWRQVWSNDPPGAPQQGDQTPD